MFVTVNYLFAAFLQTEPGGRHKILKVEKVRTGKAKFFFDIDEKTAEEAKLKFHNSCCAEFEKIRKQTIDLAYVFLYALYVLM